MSVNDSWLRRWLSLGSPTSRRRRFGLRLERLDERALPADLSLAATPFPLDPPEPLPPANLCPQPKPGIYYDAASQTVCIVGGDTNDTVLVNEFGGFFVAYL